MQSIYRIDLLAYIFIIPGMIFSLGFHEYVKALISTKLGDPVPKRRGYLTLNPLKHTDPLGVICMVLFGFGWGKPAETSPTYYKDKRLGTLITYITPSVVNIIFGLILASVLLIVKIMILNKMPWTLAMNGSAAGLCRKVLYNLARCNLAIAFFNIIPVYPLDGAKVLNLFLHPNTVIKISSYERIFQIILLIAVCMGFVGMVINPLCDALLSFAV